MIEEPPLLTVRRPSRRPTAAQIAAFQNTPTGFVADAMWGTGAVPSIDPIGFGRDRREGEDTAAIERTFTPEFRNRLDAVISFAPLGKEVILQVVEKFVLQLEAQLMDRNVHIELTRAAAEWLADKGYDDKMGARPLGRVIQEHIKKPLAEELLFGQL